MQDNAESAAPGGSESKYNENDLYNIWERLDRMASAYGVETVKEACRRYAMPNKDGGDDHD